MASQEIRKALREPFPADQVKQRQGPRGIKLDYVAGETVLQRLIDVTAEAESGYAWQINGFDVRETDKGWAVTVAGTLMIHGDAGGGIGSMVNPDLDMAAKSANTEAIKNAAKNGFGVGLELWDAEYRATLGEKRRLLAGSEQAMKAAVWKLAQERDPKAKTGAAVAKLFGIKAGDLADPDVLRAILEDAGLL